MAIDSLVDSAVLDAGLTSVADAIRAKGGTSAQLAFPAGFVSAIGAIPTGGGGGGFALLKTVTISENVNAIKVDFESSWASDYDILFIDIDATFSAGDWLYYAYNTTSPSIYLYGADAKHWVVVTVKKTNGSWEAAVQNSSAKKQAISGFPSYLYLKAYTNTKYFTDATVIKIYGGKLS